MSTNASRLCDGAAATMVWCKRVEPAVSVARVAHFLRPLQLQAALRKLLDGKVRSLQVEPALDRWAWAVVWFPCLPGEGVPTPIHLTDERIAQTLLPEADAAAIKGHLGFNPPPRAPLQAGV